ncbi:MAG: hypothetical protein KC619_06855 [Myxococcales bacterium]|nr:hypothetical protein [Myxococcales bacterium]
MALRSSFVVLAGCALVALAACSGDCVADRCDPCGGCLPWLECRGGVCVCPVGTTECGPACVTLSDDAAHCGACGNACPRGAACLGGACACPAGSAACEGTCRDVQSDPASCGACGVACAADQGCVDGLCVCDEPALDACPDGCFDLASDDSSCGACGQACPSGASCVSGVCACPRGYTVCDGACVTTLTDASHCGGCGRRCASEQRCEAGACACPGSETLCSGACVDLDADVAHCGDCTRVCDADQGCVGGRCVPSLRWHHEEPSGGSMFVGPYVWDGRVAVSPSGDIYLAFSDPDEDVQLVRLAPDGTVVWRQRFRTYARRVDALTAGDGFVVMAATFEILWTPPLSSTHYASGTGRDVAIVAVEDDGTVRWQRFVDAAGDDSAGGVAVAGDRVVIAGSVTGAHDYGGGSLPADLYRDAFVYEVSAADGSYVAARVFGTRVTQRPVFVAIRPDGDVVVAGLGNNGLSLGGPPLPSFPDGFVARLGPGLSHVWSRAFAATYVYALAIDSAGHVFISGQVTGPTDFGDGVALALGRSDAATYLLSMDGDSGASRWVTRIGGGAHDEPRGLAVDGRDHLWVAAGSAGGLGGADAILASVDPSGRLVYSRAFGGAGADHATGVAISGDTLAFAGRFTGRATFGGSVVVSTDYDVFVLSMGL